MRETLKPEIARLNSDGLLNILIADNLRGQDARRSAGDLGRMAADAAADANCEWWNTVEGCTDTIQPVDSGLGRELK